MLYNLKMRVKTKSQFDFRKSKLVLVVLICFTLIFSYYSFNVYYKKYQMEKKNAMLDKKIEELIKIQQDLKKEESILTDSRFIEREARIKLNFKKEGEEVVVFVSNNDTISEDVFQDKRKEKRDKTEYSKNPKKWLNFIFN